MSWLRSVFKQYFYDWFVRSNNRIVIFSKTKKKSYHNKHVGDNTFLFFYVGGGGGSPNWFCRRYKCVAPKWFKITTNSVIKVSIFFFNIKSETF